MSRSMRQFRGATVKVTAPQTGVPLPVGNVGSFVGRPMTSVPVVTVASILGSVVVNEVPLLNDEQVNALASLAIGGVPLLSANDRATIYEVVGILVKVGFDEGYRYLTSLVANVRPENTAAIDHVRRNIIWLSPAMEKPRQKYEIDVEIKRNKTEVVAGASRCSKCGSEEVMTAQRQTRSADEPMTNFNLCTSCGFRWKS